MREHNKGVFRSRVQLWSDRKSVQGMQPARRGRPPVTAPDLALCRTCSSFGFLDRTARRVKGPESGSRSDQALDIAVVLLHDVVPVSHGLALDNASRARRTASWTRAANVVWVTRPFNLSSGPMSQLMLCNNLNATRQCAPCLRDSPADEVRTDFRASHAYTCR